MRVKFESLPVGAKFTIQSCPGVVYQKKQSLWRKKSQNRDNKAGCAVVLSFPADKYPSFAARAAFSQIEVSVNSNRWVESVS